MSDPTRPPHEPEPTVPLDRTDLQRHQAPYQPPAVNGQAVPGSLGYGRPYAGPAPYHHADPYQQPNPYEQPPYPQEAYTPSGQMVYLQPVDPRQLAYQQSLYAAQRSRVAAGLLAIFLGSLGIHNFYLGRTGVAVAQLLITVLTLGLGSIITSVWALIEGILILTSSPGFATDARGIPLRD